MAYHGTPMTLPMVPTRGTVDSTMGTLVGVITLVIMARSMTLNNHIAYLLFVDRSTTPTHCGITKVTVEPAEEVTDGEAGVGISGTSTTRVGTRCVTWYTAHLCSGSWWTQIIFVYVGIEITNGSSHIS